MNFSSFFNYASAQPWLWVASFLTLGVVFVNGWSDAPNAIATAVSTRSIDARRAVILASICNGLGVISMGFLSQVINVGNIASTIAKIVILPTDGNGNLLAQQALIMISVAMLSILVFSIIATLIGFPSSESNELVGGLTGASVAYMAMSGASNWLSGVNWSQWIWVIVGLLASLVLGFLLGWFFVRLIEMTCRKMKRSETTKFFDVAQDFSAGAMAFMHGVQDGLKFIGIFLMIVAVAEGSPSVDIAAPTWVILIVALVMVIGTSFGGYKVIKNVGVGMVKLEKYQGFATDLAGTVGLLVATFLGWPVSTGQVKMSSILGSGAAKGIRRVRWDVAGSMIATWLITLPVSFLLGGALTALLLLIFK